jgi:hypothetical protein
MIRSVMVLVLVAAGAVAASARADGAGSRVGDPAAFLDALAGEWAVVSHATLGPGQEPVRSERREVARRIGRWVVSESTGTTPTGQPYTAIQTLGYDPARGEFVGTWIDSMQSHMWTYTGALNEQGTAVVLETEGPIMGDASRTARYREILELLAFDHRIMRSEIFGPNGEWFEFSRAEYRRVR